MTPQDPLTPSVPLSTSGLSEGEGAQRERRAIEMEKALNRLARAARRVLDAKEMWRSPDRGSHPNLVLEEAEAWIELQACFDNQSASPAPVLQGDVAGLLAAARDSLKFALAPFKPMHTRAEAEKVVEALDAYLSSLASSPIRAEGQEPIGCPCPGACSVKGPLSPNQRAAIICDFMNWPEDGPAWVDAHKLAAKLAAAVIVPSPKPTPSSPSSP